jgi:hypothetical protein
MSQGGGYGGSGGYGQNMGGGYGGGNSYGGGGWGGQPQGMGIDQRYSPLQFGGSPSYNQAWGVPQGGPRMVSDPASSFNSTGAGSDGIRPGLGNITPPPQPVTDPHTGGLEPLPWGGQRPRWGITPPPQPSPEGGGQRPPWGITPPPVQPGEGRPPWGGITPPPQPAPEGNPRFSPGPVPPPQPVTDNPWNRFQRGPMPPNRWGGY